MIENEINLIADKLGMTITQIYQMNVQYQEFVVFRNVISVFLAVIAFFVWVAIVSYAIKKNEYELDKMEKIIFFGIIMGFCISFVLFFVIALCIDGVVLPMKYPEYVAMIQTMEQIRNFVPGGGC